MTVDTHPGWGRLHEERSLGAAITLESYYGSSHSQIVVGNAEEVQPMTDQEAEKKLLHLAESIRSGEVSSHAVIARVIRSLGNKMTHSGGASAGINDAALRVEEAIIRNEFKLADGPKRIYL